jgi:peptidoglycan hydrolase-like protein with peptidoglycan-binding domain
MVMRVQLELMTLGFYSGTIDGRMSDDLRNSLRAFQIVQRLPETSAMDDATLARLGVAY